MNLRTLLGALAVALLMNACGGGKSIKSGDVRLVNLTSQALDLRVAGTTLVGAVAAGAASGYVEREDGSATFEVGPAGAAGTEFSVAGTVANNEAYTVVAFTTEKATAAVFLSDGEAEPASGSAKFRLFNAAREAGSLDVYLTSANASLSGATPINAGVGGSQIGAYAAVNPGTYRLRVTGAGARSDVRLDIAAVTITEKQIATFVVTASKSGVLVNAALMNEGGTVARFENTKSRLSVVADLTGGASVDVAVGAAPLVTGLASPQVTNYISVAADLSALSVNGRAVAGAAALAPGSDVTLLVYGDPAAPTAAVFTDDNRLPDSSNSALLRLAHGINGVPGVISLSQDSTFLVETGGLGTIKPPVEALAGTDVAYTVRAPSAPANCTSTVWTKPANRLLAGSVYTLFTLGECGGTGILALRKDR